MIKNYKSEQKRVANTKSLRRYFESCNVNFLFGSGMSIPFLHTLGNIETLLSTLEARNLGDDKKSVLKALIYAKFFQDVIWPNYAQNRIGDDYEKVERNYVEFVRIVHKILIRRSKSPGLSRRINIFTTNIDIFFEIALESAKVEWNAGFSGMMEPAFSESNYSKTVYSTSRYYNIESELPIFNLYKLHGSLNWCTKDKNKNSEILLDRDLKSVFQVHEKLNRLSQINIFRNLNSSKTLDDVFALKVEELDDENQQILSDFIKEYEKLPIVNPSKRKFSTTVLDMHFYELMRIYANELEKNNSVLLVHGFSFADEHFANITKRVAASNPTLLVLIVAFNEAAKIEIMRNLQLEENRSDYVNIEVLTYDDFDLPEEISCENKNMDFENVVRGYGKVLPCEIDHMEE